MVCLPVAYHIIFNSLVLSLFRYSDSWKTRHDKTCLSYCEQLSTRSNLRHLEQKVDREDYIRDGQPRDPCFWAYLGFMIMLHDFYDQFSTFIF